MGDFPFYKSATPVPGYESNFAYFFKPKWNSHTTIYFADKPPLLCRSRKIVGISNRFSAKFPGTIFSVPVFGPGVEKKKMSRVFFTEIAAEKRLFNSLKTAATTKSPNTFAKKPRLHPTPTERCF